MNQGTLLRWLAAALLMAALSACNTSISGLTTGGGKSARELAAEQQAIDAQTTGKIAQPVTEQSDEPVAAVQEPVAPPKEEPVAAVQEPAAPPKEEPVAAVQEPAAPPKEEPVAAVQEPVAPPKEEPVAAVPVAKPEPAATEVAAPAEEKVAAKAETVAATPAAETGEAAKTETANIIRQQSSVSKRGTYIRALVNGAPITNYDVQRRIKFRQLRREGGGEQAALEELVDDHLKMQEARRLNAVATDAQVNEAFDNFARSNKATPSQVAGELDRMGIGVSQFKDFIRTQISWRRAVGSLLRAQTIDKSQSEAIFELRKTGGQKPTLTEYRLQQIIFVIPEDRRKALLAARKNEALNFRQSFTGCRESFELAKTLRDVAVKNLGLMFEPEIPPEWKEEVTSLAVGETTKPKETAKGVEILAVCDAQVSADDRAAQISAQAQTIGDLETKGDEEADKILAELRKNATIIYR